ncbi:hypothetical protein Pmani_020757 [Petrolisthes manimaculis]|uniref:Uncharacterized protein n=1 Tax=Petrolisthes manimaculis TaxID=1843537 RepID=A0AAE1PHR9_9EUCA|nr:hypothetical protein Pmani_020757 [Petrolisthes manimaculis]
MSTELTKHCIYSLSVRGLGRARQVDHVRSRELHAAVELNYGHRLAHAQDLKICISSDTCASDWWQQQLRGEMQESIELEMKDERHFEKQWVS